MKNILIVAVIFILCWQMTACSKDEAPPPLDSTDKQFSYVMGYEAVGVLESFGTVSLDEKALLNGIQDALEQRHPRFPREQALRIKSLVFEKERNFKNQQSLILARTNREEQRDFLEKNRQAEGVVTLDSGLQYLVLREGDGPRPSVSDNVRMHIKGSLPDGTVFDSTYADGSPVVQPVKGDLPVWEEALPLMRVGSKYRFFVPSELAYGEEGTMMRGGIIGPHQLLVLEMELLEIAN